MTTSAGDRIEVPAGGLLFLVGPNNSGKSAALREIATWLAHFQERANRVVLKSVEFSHIPPGELIAAMKDVYPSKELENKLVQFRVGGGRAYNLFPGAGSEQTYEAFFSALLLRLDTERRLTDSNPVDRIDVFGDEVPQAGIHWLQKDEAIAKKVNGIVRSAFGADLIINWGGGNTVRFHVGDEPVVTAEHDRVSESYLRALNQLPRLENLGDGIRSFVTTVVAAHVGPHPVLLIDEPEAFLHPPQATRLGQVLARLIKEQGRQAIIATHSSDLIRGALNGSPNVAICRLERRDTTNKACVLNADDLKGFWSSPLLRSSQAVNGLFHEGIVVCEADSDARFYEAVLASIANRFDRPIDLYFVHGGGKGALAQLAEAYYRLQIPTAVVADLDLLKNQNDFKRVFESVGGSWRSIESLCVEASRRLSDIGAIVSPAEFTAELKKIMADVEANAGLTPETKRTALALLDDATDWSDAKRYGIDKLRGGARGEVKLFLDECATIGLFMVPKGELESWWRDGPASKKDWAPQAINRLGTDPREFAEAQAFVTRICEYLGYRAG